MKMEFMLALATISDIYDISDSDNLKMISLDAMMKFVAGPASDASTLSSGDQPSTSSSVGAGAAMVSSSVGQGGTSIKTEMGDHKKVSERKPTGEKKIFKKTKFVPP